METASWWTAFLRGGEELFVETASWWTAFLLYVEDEFLASWWTAFLQGGEELLVICIVCKSLEAILQTETLTHNGYIQKKASIT